jgi:hypothetical protein
MNTKMCVARLGVNIITLALLSFHPSCACVVSHFHTLHASVTHHVQILQLPHALKYKIDLYAEAAWWNYMLSPFRTHCYLLLLYATHFKRWTLVTRHVPAHMQILQNTHQLNTLRITTHIAHHHSAPRARSASAPRFSADSTPCARSSSANPPLYARIASTGSAPFVHSASFGSAPFACRASAGFSPYVRSASVGA